MFKFDLCCLRRKSSQHFRVNYSVFYFLLLSKRNHFNIAIVVLFRWLVKEPGQSIKRHCNNLARRHPAKENVTMKQRRNKI